MKKTSFCLIMVCSVMIARCYAEGLDALIELGRGQTEIQRAYEEESDIYGRVKRAVESGEIKKGDRGDDVKVRYGEPVVITGENGTTRKIWIYKPAASSFFKGERVNLCFNADGLLDEITVRQ